MNQVIRLASSDEKLLLMRMASHDSKPHCTTTRPRDCGRDSMPGRPALMLSTISSTARTELRAAAAE